MKRKIISFLLSVVMAGFACFVLDGQPAYAEEPAASETPESGNLTVVEQEANATQEFYQVQSKNGNTFYIIIDRTKNTENVYFLNQVDEADLMALIGSDDIQPSNKKCICNNKCTVGDINTDCPVCAINMTECFGTEEQEQEQKLPEMTPSPDKGSAAASEEDLREIQIPKQVFYAIPIVIVLGIILIITVVKKKKGKKSTAEDEVDDEYVFEDDDGDEDVDNEDEYA